MAELSEAQRVALDITECPIVKDCFAGLDRTCVPIVCSQGKDSLANFQVPEPWSGHLAVAPLLFLSSNPSIADDEEYPIAEWSPAQRLDFFDDRFNQARAEPWVDTHMRARKRVGLPPPQGRGTRFWLAVHARAHELIDDPTAGIDYALSEVVHCKSRRQEGVGEAFEACVDRWLARVLRVSAARVIVTLGVEAERAVHRVNAVIPERARLTGPLTVEGRERLVVQLPHPNAHVARVNCAPLEPEELAMVRSFLAAG